MDHYDRRMVTAPGWMESFSCTAGNCPETCCQQWNIDVDPGHAELYMRLEDPGLRPVMDHLLRGFRIRRRGMQTPEMNYRLLLLDQPDGRCPFLNENAECRLQKKYGAYILCDTCYFHPRTFWQIDDQMFMSACLSCPECARLALLHTGPTVFTKFEAEIDPNAEWLETSMISDPGAAVLMRNRQILVRCLCGLLQDRNFTIARRIANAERFLSELGEEARPDPDTIRFVLEKVQSGSSLPENTEDPAGLMQQYLEIIDPVGENSGKPVQSAAELTRALAGGKEGFLNRLAENYEAGCMIMDPFLRQNGHLIENFLVHCVFSDSFREFSRCRNEAVTIRGILRHESALLRIWYLLFRTELARAALCHGSMSEELFMRSVIQMDRTWWHYPDWFARCAERAVSLQTGPDLPL